MANVNPGPAITSNPNSTAELAPVQTQQIPFPQGQNGIRLLAAAKGVNCAVSGDVAVTTVINAVRWIPTAVIVASQAGQTQTPATAYLGVFTAPAQAAYTVLANAVLTSLAAAAIKYAAAANTTGITTDQNIYVNVGTTTASGIVDVLVYGYDLST